MASESDFLKRAGKAGKSPTVEVEDVDWPDYYPILDQVVVRPIDPPSQSKGGIAFDRRTVLAERSQTCVGQIVAMGSLAYTAETRDGVKFWKEVHIPVVGDWVLFTKAAGQPVSIKHSNATDPTLSPRLIAMSDNDIKGVFKNEAEARKVWAWAL